VDGKFYSPRGIHAHGDAPNVELCDLEGLRFEGGKLQGELKWVSPAGAVETLAFDAGVRDGVVAGKAGQAELTGWLRSDEQMALVNGFAADKNWPELTGPDRNWSGTDTGTKLVTDFSQSLLVWFSEADFGGGRETRQCPMRWVSGAWSPIVGEGRIYFIHQRPGGEVIDEAAQAQAQKMLDTLLAKPNVLLDPAVRRAKERGARHWARVDGDDVIVCVDAASGKTVWETVLPGRSFNPQPYNKHADQTRTGCYGDGKVFMLGRTFRLYACDARTGKLLWESALPKIHEQYEALKKKALADKKLIGPGDYAPLHYAGGVVFSATLAGEVAGFDAATGRLLWTTKGAAPGLWRHEGKEYALVNRSSAPSSKGQVACVELATGKEVWTAPVEGSAEGPAFHLRLLGSYLVTSHIGKTEPHFLAGYKVEPAGLKQLWKRTDEKAFLHGDNPTTMHRGLIYTRLNERGGDGRGKSTVMAIEPETGKIVASGDVTGGSGRNGVLIVNDGLLIVQLDGSHPSSQGDLNITVLRLPDLERLGGLRQTHNTTGGYDTPMSFQYVDGRLVIRGCNRIACYDLRQPEVQR
jgi:outer membrane protein assembly factor BamB